MNATESPTLGTDVSAPKLGEHEAAWAAVFGVISVQPEYEEVRTDVFTAQDRCVATIKLMAMKIAATKEKPNAVAEKKEQLEAAIKLLKRGLLIEDSYLLVNTEGGMTRVVGEWTRGSEGTSELKPLHEVDNLLTGCLFFTHADALERTKDGALQAWSKNSVIQDRLMDLYVEIEFLIPK